MTTHQRHSGRLQDYDYSSEGGYFVTICTQNRKCLFGQIENGYMRLNEWGRIVEAEWLKTSILRPNVELDTYVVMPNHFHAILHITTRGGSVHGGDVLNTPIPLITPANTTTNTGRMQYAPTAGFRSPSQTLGAIVRGFKSAVTKRIDSNLTVWQQNYYDHVIRNEKSLMEIRQYIVDNPTKWDLDRNNPKNT